MSTPSKVITIEELFRKKESRRRALAIGMSFEDKLQAVVKLQNIATSMGRSAGRETRKPWETRVRSHS